MPTVTCSSRLTLAARSSARSPLTAGRGRACTYLTSPLQRLTRSAGSAVCSCKSALEPRRCAACPPCGSMSAPRTARRAPRTSASVSSVSRRSMRRAKASSSRPGSAALHRTRTTTSLSPPPHHPTSCPLVPDTSLSPSTCPPRTPVSNALVFILLPLPLFNLFHFSSASRPHHRAAFAPSFVQPFSATHLLLPPLYSTTHHNTRLIHPFNNSALSPRCPKLFPPPLPASPSFFPMPRFPLLSSPAPSCAAPRPPWSLPSDHLGM
mmetsp:Transcript_4668/g.8067  ORF Transcript_4668/g.8067 Transcript_4668/m.8067 type:complete len:265 (+) Transcript_4668:494-1288(+)